MTPENQEKLINVYPGLFSEVHHQMPYSLFGFECDDGWFDLLHECIQEIKEACEKEKLDIKVNQIKEKYGTLRFYVCSYPESIRKIIDKAEERSAKTCESCGKPATVIKVRPHWVQCCCEECLETSSGYKPWAC